MVLGIVDSIGGQFDDEPGGGFGDWASGGTADLVFEDPDEGMDFWMPWSDGETADDTAGDSIDLWGPSTSEGVQQGVVWAAEGTGDVASAAGGAFWGEVKDSPVVLAVLGLVAAYILGQLFDVDLGGESA